MRGGPVTVSKTTTLMLDGATGIMPAILHNGEPSSGTGIIIVTGGPQYRIGSHRQFVLIARELAAAGHAVLRFDYQGMGDSPGPLSDFEHCLPDLQKAIEQFRSITGVKKLVLWGLCDAASAILMLQPEKHSVDGVVIANPWVRSEAGRARSVLKHYYVRRFFSADFWKKVLSGQFKPGKSMAELSSTYKVASSATNDPDSHADKTTAVGGDFREKMFSGLASFDGSVLLIICGADLTAHEFVDFTNGQRRWRKLLSRPAVTKRTLAGADHTFSNRADRDTIVGWTIDWVESL